MEYIDIEKFSEEALDLLSDESFEIIESYAQMCDILEDKRAKSVIKTYLTKGNYAFQTSIDLVYDELWEDSNLDEKLAEINEDKSSDCPDFFGFIQVIFYAKSEEREDEESVALAAILFPICSYEMSLQEQLEQCEGKITVQFLPNISE